MKIMVTDRHSIESGVVVRTPYIVVSIRDPGTPKPRIPRTSGLKAVLHLAFHDAEPAKGFKTPSKIVFMRPAQAKAIWRFVKRHKDAVGSVVCHCEQGMSRSPAVALALAEALGSSAKKIRANYQPNQYVYDLMRAATASGCSERGSKSPTTKT
jgi:predicted protein tyrosine phosphatase